MRISGYYGRYNVPVIKRGEFKFHDVAMDDANISTTGTILQDSVNLIAQGTTESTRIGRKCNIRNIHWRYTIQKDAESVLGGDDVVRVILYLDKQANGAAAAVLDILETADYQSFYNLANSNRFRILMDKTWDMNAHAGGGNGTAVDSFAFSRSTQFRKNCNIPIEFSSTTGALTEIRSNNIGVLTISERASTNFESNMRLRFTG